MRQLKQGHLFHIERVDNHMLGGAGQIGHVSGIDDLFTHIADHTLVQVLLIKGIVAGQTPNQIFDRLVQQENERCRDDLDKSHIDVRIFLPKFS